MGRWRAAPQIKDGDWISVRQAINRLSAIILGSEAEPSYAGLTLTGLTSDRLIGSSSGKLQSEDLTAWIAGTANQITVTDDTDGSVTLSTPQDIHTGATPTFSGLGITNDLDVGGDLTVTGGDVLFSNTGSSIVEIKTVRDTDDARLRFNVPNIGGSFGVVEWYKADVLKAQLFLEAGANDGVTLDLNDNGVFWVEDGSMEIDDDLDVGGDVEVGGVVQATDFAKTGWPRTSGVTLSFDDASKVFTVTDGGSAYYYINGVKYTLGGNKTVDLDDVAGGAVEGLWYIYFDGATLTASQTIWSFSAEDKALVAYLYWDATNSKAISLGTELHTFYMDGATHARMHHAGGARWETGLLVADVGSEEVNVSAGDIWDEDLNIAISDGAGSSVFEQILSPAELPIYYRSGASAWRVYETTEKANAVDAGYVDGSNDLKYNKLDGTWTNATVGLNNYVAYYVVATNEQTEPIALFMGQRVDNKLSDAKVNNVFSGLSLAGMPFQEAVVLARLILKGTGSGVYYTLEEVLDLRAYNIKGNITSPLITQHAGLGGLDFASAGHSGFQAQATYVAEYMAMEVIE